MLSERLQELEAEGIVERTVIPETPVRVEYALTRRAARSPRPSTPSPRGPTSGATPNRRRAPHGGERQRGSERAPTYAGRRRSHVAADHQRGGPVARAAASGVAATGREGVRRGRLHLHGPVGGRLHHRGHGRPADPHPLHHPRACRRQFRAGDGGRLRHPGPHRRCRTEKRVQRPHRIPVRSDITVSLSAGDLVLGALEGNKDVSAWAGKFRWRCRSRTTTTPCRPR